MKLQAESRSPPPPPNLLFTPPEIPSANTPCDCKKGNNTFYRFTTVFKSLTNPNYHVIRAT
jgi:hypothetical protein